MIYRININNKMSKDKIFNIHEFNVHNINPKFEDIKKLIIYYAMKLTKVIFNCIKNFFILIVKFKIKNKS